MMKVIRTIVTILLFANATGHVLLFIQDPAEGPSALVLVFGIIYFMIGVLFLLKKKYSPVLGIIVPLTGMISGLIAFDPKEVNMLLSVLGIVDLTILILCSILVLSHVSRVK